MAENARLVQLISCAVILMTTQSVSGARVCSDLEGGGLAPGGDRCEGQMLG